VTHSIPRSLGMWSNDPTRYPCYKLTDTSIASFIFVRKSPFWFLYTTRYSPYYELVLQLGVTPVFISYSFLYDLNSAQCCVSHVAGQLCFWPVWLTSWANDFLYVCCKLRPFACHRWSAAMSLWTWLVRVGVHMCRHNYIAWWISCWRWQICHILEQLLPQSWVLDAIDDSMLKNR